MNIYNHFKTSILSIAVAATMLTACDKDVFDINTDPFKDETYTTTLTSPIASFLEEAGGYGEYVKLLRYSNMFNALCGLYPLMDEMAPYFKSATNDRLHPNDEGHARLAKTIMQQLIVLPIY